MRKDTRSETSLKPETVQREEKIVPLFQVAYDRTLCRPLGTLVDFNRLTPKLKEFLKRIEVKDEYPTNALHSPSRSVSPFSPLPSATTNGPVVNDTTKSKPKSSAPKMPDLRQNALTVFEFSTVYPFVYGNNKFKCFICSQPFLETPPLKEHMSSTHTFAPLKRLINNRRETVIKVDVSSITCKICTTSFKDLTSLKVHLKDVHEKPLDTEVKDNMIPFKLDEGLYKCVLCDQIFIKVRLLVIHMSVHFSNYSCDVCGSGFMTLRLLKKHLEVHENGNFPCDRCEKVFNTSHKRSLHIRGVHLKQCPRRCPICPERFNSNYRRTIHLQDVHNQSTRVHKCDICGRGFNLKYHLISHTRAVHLQERNQQCKLCLQRFCSKETLKRHMVIHTGEKNYKCEVCGYIEESNSSIVLKNEDGTVTRLTLLKRPIPLASLEYEIVNKKTHDRTKVVLHKNMTGATDDSRQCRAANGRNLESERETKTTNVGLLKDPISLDYLKSNKGFEDRDEFTSITFNAKIVQGAYPSGRCQRRRTTDMECRIWKQNALTIFKYSQVYPFLYVKNKYKCYICSRHFLESSMLKHHTLKEHDANELEQELNNRARDKYLKVDVSSLDCKICLYIAPDLHTLKVHLKSHGKAVDPDLKDNIVPFKLGGDTHDCQYCDETFIKLRLLVIHMSKHFNNYSCEICGAVSISLDLLKRHLKIHETGTFPCGICDKIFSNAAKRSIHIRGVHLKQFPRRCPICPARFNSNFQRTKHLRIVHNQTSGLFKCETCGREYDLKYHLLIHIRSVHLQERNHECPTCHARFFSKYSLSRHMIIHTGEKNFKCEICGKAYARSKNLREHSRTHTIGPNPCAVCGQSFLDHTALSNHMNVVHGLCDYKHVF